MARTIKFTPEGNRDRIDTVLERRRTNAAARNRPRGGRQGVRVATRREAVLAR